MDKNIIKEIMLKAIAEPRPNAIVPFCRPVWNQPFFFQLDCAKAITISYAPTDKGARTNYADIYNRYRENKESLSAEDIYNILYDFKKERYWRNKYDRIFASLGIACKEIAHMDMSSFPYDKDIYRKQFIAIDNTYRYTLQTISLLSDQLQYILVDGKDNKKIIDDYFAKDYVWVKQTKLVVNNSNRKSDLIVYRHKTKNIKLIYFGTFLYGATCVSDRCIDELIRFVND